MQSLKKLALLMMVSASLTLLGTYLWDSTLAVSLFTGVGVWIAEILIRRLNLN